MTDIGFLLVFPGLGNGIFQWIWIFSVVSRVINVCLNINQLLVQRYTGGMPCASAVLLNFYAIDFTAIVVKQRIPE